MNSNGIITAPVNTDDVRAVTGENSHDVGTLCMSAKINKWSYRKPIVYPTPGLLTEAQFIGTTEDINNGYYCGVRMAPAQGAIGGLHNVDYSYKRPGATDWKRLSDFEGYDQAAKPRESATLSPTLQYGGGFMVRLDYDLTNTTGISLRNAFDVFANNTDLGYGHTFEKSYLCMLVSTTDKKHNAYIALKNRSTGTVTPIADSQGSFYEAFEIDLPKGTAPSWLDVATGTEFLVSIFLAYSLMPKGQNDHDLTTWSYLENTSGSPKGCFGIPLATGKRIPVANLLRGGGIEIKSVTKNSTGFTIKFENQSNIKQVDVSIRAESSSYDGKVDKSFTVAAGTSTNPAVTNGSVTWSELGMSSASGTINVSIYYKLAGETTSKHYETNITK